MTYNWNLKDTVFAENAGTVFSCFSAGGGSYGGLKTAVFLTSNRNSHETKT